MGALIVVLVIVVVLVVAIGGFVVVGLNRLRGQRVSVDEAMAGIDVQLTRRSDLIPNLVETVKGYMGHERQTLEAVTEARARVDRASGVRDKAAADGQMQQALANLFAVAEAYPDLKASANFQQLQSELSRTEDQLAFARQYYNDAVATLNRTMVTIPWSMLVGMSGVEKGEFYDAPEASTAPPEVRF
ncbi:MAG TPA: LemA family protein [Microthrixaceae bacterium]|jgi:LemA protein|nr:LemA family protein [Microthrixaceae bacterium]